MQFIKVRVFQKLCFYPYIYLRSVKWDKCDMYFNKTKKTCKTTWHVVLQVDVAQNEIVRMFLKVGSKTEVTGWNDQNVILKLDALNLMIQAHTNIE